MILLTEKQVFLSLPLSCCDPQTRPHAESHHPTIESTPQTLPSAADATFSLQLENTQEFNPKLIFSLLNTSDDPSLPLKARNPEGRELKQGCEIKRSGPKEVSLSPVGSAFLTVSLWLYLKTHVAGILVLKSFLLFFSLFAYFLYLVKLKAHQKRHSIKLHKSLIINRRRILL